MMAKGWIFQKAFSVPLLMQIVPIPALIHQKGHTKRLQTSSYFGLDVSIRPHHHGALNSWFLFMM